MNSASTPSGLLAQRIAAATASYPLHGDRNNSFSMNGKISRLNGSFVTTNITSYCKAITALAADPEESLIVNG